MKYVFGCGWLKGSLRSTHTLMQIQTVKMLSNPRLPLAALRILFFHFFFSPNQIFYLHSAPSSLSAPLTAISVCSSAPVSMKIQPLNRTALMVSWERPLTVYHPPITSYTVSYSWAKRDEADENTFTKTGDQSMVSTDSWS